MENNPELKTSEYLKGIVLNLPESPGIYQYLNTEGVIIYVGKAKNLKRRVSSYFNKEHEPGKTRVLVSKIADIRYIVVNTEEDALLLENNLIKKYRPRYNVLLKDDKTYPSICVQNEYFPRVFKTRKIIRNGSSYYGPYSHIPSMNALLDLIKHLYPLRTCNLNLSPENINAGKFNVCLEYHIKNCAGPCIGKQSLDDYLKNIGEIKEILKGNTQEIQRHLFQQMQELATDMRFEEAQKVKEKYMLIENYRAKSEVVSNVLHNIDVFTIEEDSDGKSAFINYLHITNGAINQAFTFEYKKRLYETKEELLELGIIEMRERYKSLSREIIVPFEVDMELKDVVFTIPQRGDKKKLLDLSILNVKQYKADRMKQAEKFGRPIITFIDTPGAYPGKEAEERGQGEAIARNLMEMSGLTVPVIAVVTGEGSSGGALALGVANHILMLENAVYSVLSPEGFASILWKDSSRSGEACEIMKLTAQDLYKDGIVEEIIPEPVGGAQRSHAALFAAMDTALKNHLTALCKMSGKALADQRYKKFRQIGEAKRA